MIKKMMNKAFGFTMAGILAGAFYREFTVFLGVYGEPTMMSVLHTHTFALGAFVSFFLVLFTKSFGLDGDRDLEKRYNGYFISVLGVLGTMLARGFMDIFENLGSLEVTSTMNGIMSGVSAVTHIAITITMFRLFNYLRKEVARVSE